MNRDGNSIIVQLDFEEETDKNDIRAFIAFKDSNGILRGIDILTLTDELSVDYQINESLGNMEITIYVWDKNNKPYIDKIIVE